MIRVAINGFGRIGRLFFRQAFGNPNIEIVAINDLGSVENLAYLLKHDTTYRTYNKEVRADVARGILIVDGKEIKFLQQKDPVQLPWKDLAIDAVLESTGIFESFEKAKVHIDAGAKHVVITAPAKDEDGPIGQTVLMGINGEMAKTFPVTSNASCTTNGASPMMAVLSENPGIVKAILTTVHAYTATQSVVDGPVKGDDWRRGRSAAQNIVPSTTGAAIAVTRALPELVGKFDGIAIRVPVVTGSLVDVTFVAKRQTTVEEINTILKNAAQEPRWQGIFGVTDEQLVSSDIIEMPYAALVDMRLTKVIDGDLVKVSAWYDNEWGYTTTLVKHIAALA
ncbi:MAG: type I glyceraldehyde-3-phosphate dehydrogenase [Candidatus Paceibacterota bacterium]|jgi:glyceraldehyde 3-phosphate dehydrogenase